MLSSLDFVKVGKADINKLFLTSALHEKCKEYIPVPLALHRDPKTI